MYLLFCFCVKIIMEVFKVKKGQTKRIWTVNASDKMKENAEEKM